MEVMTHEPTHQTDDLQDRYINSFFQDTLFQDTFFQDTFFQDTLFQEALLKTPFTDVLFQDGLFQETLFQETLFQDSLFQDTLFKDTLIKTDNYQLINGYLDHASPFYLFIQGYPKLSKVSNQLVSWDSKSCIWLNQLSQKKGVGQFFKVISRLGDGWFWYLMLAAAFAIGGMAKAPLILATIVTSLIGVAIYKLLKIKTLRPRPYQVNPVIQVAERPLDTFSFPSGHTMQAVLFTTTLGGFFPTLWLMMASFSLLVALSRPILGLHYPSDVLVGATLGFTLSLLAIKTVPIMTQLFL